MKQWNSKDLLTDLRERSEAVLQAAQDLEALDDAALNYRPAEGSWSILECLEHLNFYADFYHPALKARMEASTHRASTQFKSGWLGDYFARMMLPGAKPIKTFSDKNPLGSALQRESLHKFIAHQQTLLALLAQAEGVHLGRVKVAVSIAKFIKLKLGDALRVIIYHNQRHMAQIARVQEAMPARDRVAQVS